MSAVAKIPSQTVADEARQALHALMQVIPRQGAAQVRVLGEGEAGFSLPREVVELLLEVLGQMAKGNGVRIVPIQAELTTQQAAEVLNVSRPFLIGLLDAGKIPFRMVGTHRRIRCTDLMAYKQQDDARRDAAVTELTQQAQDLGLGY